MKAFVVGNLVINVRHIVSARVTFACDTGRPSDCLFVQTVADAHRIDAQHFGGSTATEQLAAMRKAFAKLVAAISENPD